MKFPRSWSFGGTGGKQSSNSLSSSFTRNER
nr:MAG TPA: hypothetical protein [Caudoviricetes sp.]DAY27517.1 MAG TPA: hypothetical protein [Caudoviricetes sp.]